MPAGTDATGTPTSLGIRKINTSVDAPSGLGTNGAMDDIDALLLLRVSKPAGIAVGEVPVWNGSAFVRSSASGISTVNNYASVTVSGANTDIAWNAAWTGNVVTLMCSPVGGTFRSLGSPSTGPGTRVILRNGAGGTVQILHQVAGGAGAQFNIRGGASLTLGSAETMEFSYDGTVWVEINRDQPAASSTQGSELGYTEFTSNVSATGTTEATANVVVTSASITFDGAPVICEFFSPAVLNPGSADTRIILRDDTGAVVLGQLARVNTNGATIITTSVRAARRFTPAAGARVYSVRAWVSAGTGTVSAGAGGSGSVDLPGYIRFTKV